MLKDFAKLETFLAIVKERSFSKASKKLGISQPAVTQQVKWLEEYLGSKVIERKKNGITLTKSGEELYRIALRLNKCITSIETDIIKIIYKRLSFIIGASFVIGNYVVPTFLNDIKSAINNDVTTTIELSQTVLDMLQDKKIDLALIESPIFIDGVIYREWLEDEFVLFSNIPFSRTIEPKELLDFNWICRNEGSHARKIMSEALEETNIECKSFNIKTTVSTPTALIQTVLRAPKDGERTVAITSKLSIESELETGRLFTTKIKGISFKRNFYVAYLKEKRYDAFIDKVVNYIMNRRKI
jgi:DNA-binding transcriptional LysR family regulator